MAGGRLKSEFLDRLESFADRVLSVAEVLRESRRSNRLVEQLEAAGTSVAANGFEAAEALSRPDFCKTIGIMIKELNEARFWCRLFVRRGWIPGDRLGPLEAEAVELKRILGSILTRSRTPKGG